MDHTIPFLSIKTGQISICSKKRQDEINKTDLALYLHAPAKQFNPLDLQIKNKRLSAYLCKKVNQRREG